MKQLPDMVSWLNKSGAWIKANRTMLILAVAIGLLAWVPLYGILFPPLVDLPEHLLISKLLWEKVTGVSHLDLEFSWILCYRLFPTLMLLAFSWCNLWGISFISLPRLVSMALIALHVIVVVGLLFSRLKDKSWKSYALAACVSLPAVVCMYSACWFIGFVNYTLAITLLVPAVFLTERFLGSGKRIDAFWLFFSLLLVYAAHPFGVAFWLLWCASRGVAGVASEPGPLKWKKLLSLGLVFLPILLYHFLATRNTSLSPSSHSLLTKPAILSVTEWYENRFRYFFDGGLLKPDDAADSRFFARFAIGLILFATVLAFRAADRHLRKMMLASLILIFVASWVNEKFVPIPGGVWLAYDYRFSSTVYAIGLALAGMVLIHFLPALTDRPRNKMLFVVLAVLCVFASIIHLKQVRTAYKRYDVQARKYMAKVFKHERPTGISLPHSRWHPDGTLIKLYACLVEPDCNLPGTTFHTGYVKELYPVKLNSPARILSRRELTVWRKHLPAGPLVGEWRFDEVNPRDVCLDSSGNGNSGKPTGTTVVEGKSGKARSFNGRGDSIVIPPINIPKAVTVAAWVYSSNFRQNGFVITKNPVNTQWALIFESDGYLKWRGTGFEKNVKCAAPANNTWHYIVGKHDGTTGSLYVDGVLCASGALPAIGNAAGSITIGGFEGGKAYYFSGRIDEVRIYNRALSDSEIAELYKQGQSPPLPPVPEAPVP